MEQATDAAPSGSEQIEIPNFLPPAHKAGGEGELSVRDAARSLTDWRRKQAAGQDAEPPAPVKQSEPQGEDAGPSQEAPGETQEAEPEQPAIDPPRSWTKEQRERFASLPRDTQEYLLERETERDREVHRRFNEAAEI